MPRTIDNEDDADGQDGGKLPPAADDTRVDDEQSGEAGAAVKRVRVPDDSSDDNNLSSDEGDLNPS